MPLLDNSLLERSISVLVISQKIDAVIFMYTN